MRKSSQIIPREKTPKPPNPSTRYGDEPGKFTHSFPRRAKYILLLWTCSVILPKSGISQNRDRLRFILKFSFIIQYGKDLRQFVKEWNSYKQSNAGYNPISVNILPISFLYTPFMMITTSGLYPFRNSGPTYCFPMPGI